MSYYAFLDENNIVVEVIAGKDDADVSEDWEQYYGSIRNMVCKKTSITGEFRKNYAGIGYVYDQVLDAFIAPKPYPSWLLNTDTAKWESPVPYPNDGKQYYWDETTQSWVEITGA